MLYYRNVFITMPVNFWGLGGTPFLQALLVAGFTHIFTVIFWLGLTIVWIKWQEEMVTTQEWRKTRKYTISASDCVYNFCLQCQYLGACYLILQIRYAFSLHSFSAEQLDLSNKTSPEHDSVKMSKCDRKKSCWKPQEAQSGQSRWPGSVFL